MQKQTITEHIKDWAQSQDSIRAVLLTSSQTSHPDALSDTDVILVCSDTDIYTTTDTWFTFIDDVLVRFKDQWEHNGDIIYTRLIIYKDGTKVDFTIQSASSFKKVLASETLPDNLDIGYEVLLDKDAITTTLKPPSHKAHIRRKPTETEYQELVEEFYWESSYVAKNLWRNKLFPMKSSFDSVMKLEILKKMLEWYVETEHNWSIDPGSHGRHLKAYMPVHLWREIESIFVGASVEENWTALFKTIDIFRTVSISVADNLGFVFPQDKHNSVIVYLKNIQHLPPQKESEE